MVFLAATGALATHVLNDLPAYLALEPAAASSPARLARCSWAPTPARS